jgi:DNA-binding GntR family transcriptional regulator
VYQVPTAHCCPPEEHRELARALERRQSRAVGLMVRHLERVRADLKLEEVPDKRIDLHSVFSNGRRAP